MRVGLVGVAGVDKTKLAKEIQNRMYDERQYNPVNVVDYYANDVADNLSFEEGAVGPDSRYVVNLLVAAEREQQEQAWRIRQSDTISCGTIIDTIGYQATMVMAIQPLIEQSEQFKDRFAKEFAALQLLILMASDILLYDTIFYLPVPKSAALEIPGQPPKFSDGLLAVDEQIRGAIEHLKFPVNTLEGTFDENVERVFECFSPSVSSVS